MTVECFTFPGGRKLELLGTKVEAALLERHETGSSKETRSAYMRYHRINC